MLARQVAAKFAPAREIVRHRFRDEHPEVFRMIVLAEVAELVHDDVIRELARQKEQCV